MSEDPGHHRALDYFMDERNGLLAANDSKVLYYNLRNALSEFGEDVTLRELATELNDENKVKEFSTASRVRIIPLEKLMKSITTSAEEILNKLRLISSQRTELDLINKAYKHGASGVRPQSTGQGATRTDDVIMVLGESGIGKTFFSVNEATESEYGESFDKKVYHIRVHIYATSHGVDDEAYAVKLVESVKKLIQNHAPNMLATWNSLNMRLSVIVDECGANIEFFTKKYNIDLLYSKIRELSELEEKPCRLILAGVGLDSATSNISSTYEVRKYRLRPWVRDNLAVAWAGETYLNNLLKAIDTEPALLHLCSNGRVARHVMKVLLNSAWLRDGRIERSSMGLHFIVDCVCGEFMNENGLGKLKEDERRVVAFLVLQQLDYLRHEGAQKPLFPDFSLGGEIIRQDFIRCAQGMVRINVESQNDNLVLLDSELPSMTISPAMTMILYYMLGPRQQIASSWSLLETVCALSMIKKKVLQGGFEDSTMYKIARLRERVPEPKANTNFKIPYAKANTVWINGDKAPFADTVCHFELRQSKFRMESNEGACKADLREELGKCGLLKLSNEDRKIRTNHEYFKGQVVISCLWEIWNGNLDPPTLEPTSTGVGQQSRKEWSHLYPEILLNTPEVNDAVPMVKVKIEKSDPKYDDKGKAESYVAEIEMGGKLFPFVKSFDESVSFYFCTNKSEFQLIIPKDDGNKTAISIKSSDVDREGKLVDETKIHFYSKFVAENVKEGVLIRFMFGSMVLVELQPPSADGDEKKNVSWAEVVAKTTARR